MWACVSRKKDANISTGHLVRERIYIWTKKSMWLVCWLVGWWAHTHAHTIKCEVIHIHRKARRAYLVRKTESRKSSKDWNGTDISQRFLFIYLFFFLLLYLCSHCAMIFLCALVFCCRLLLRRRRHRCRRPPWLLLLLLLWLQYMQIALYGF